MSTSMSGGRGPMGIPTGSKIPKGYQQGALSQYTPEQSQLFQQMMGQIGPGSQTARLAGGDQGMFNEMEAPAMRQFQALQGQLGSRFSGMGMGAQKSSGFQNAASQASSDFAQDLMSRRQGLQRQAMMDMQGIGESLLGQRPFEQFLTPQKKPFWQELLMGLSPGIGQGAGTAGSLWGMGKLGLLV